MLRGQGHSRLAAGLSGITPEYRLSAKLQLELGWVVGIRRTRAKLSPLR
jgi:hypothetical protein